MVMFFNLNISALYLSSTIVGHGAKIILLDG